MLGAVAALLACGSLLPPCPAEAARIKDLVQIDGVRENQLIGFGLVGGLTGTGDDPKNAPYTAEAIANMLATLGFMFEPALLRVKNFAGVMVTADMPAYLSEGDRLDITVSAIGSAKSLSGGVLYQTMLRGLDGEVYAVAQGQVSLGGVVGGGGGGGGGRGKAHQTVGRIPGGALVEKAVRSSILKGDGSIHLNLKQPDFTTAQAIVVAINAALGDQAAYALDAGSISVLVPLLSLADLVPFIAGIETLDVEPGSVAKVVINQRTGTVVLGHDVTIMPVAVSHGTMTLTFGKRVAMPGMDGGAADQNTEEAADGDSAPATLDGAALMRQPTTAEEVATGLNKMSLQPQDIIAIFEALAAAGALLGELEII